MKGVHRQQRAVRPNKVVKSGAPQRPGSASRLAARIPDLPSLVAAQESQSGGSSSLADHQAAADLAREVELHPHLAAAYSDAANGLLGNPADQYATAAAAVQQHQHHSQQQAQQQQQQQQQVAYGAAAGGAEDGEGDEEADAEMDDDAVTTAMAQHAEHMDLTAANILANGGSGAGTGVDQSATAHHPAHQQHQPAAPMGSQQQMAVAAGGHGMEQQPLVKTTEDVAVQSGYPGLIVESALAKRLAREPGLRIAHQRRPEQSLNLARRSNVEALFAHIAGTLAPQPCKNCHKGHGPWNSCIIVDGQMCGSCANCWFNASGARCSFHETRNPSAMGHHPPVMTQFPDPTGQYIQQPNMIPVAPNAPNPGINNTLGLNIPMSPIVHHTVTSAYEAVRKADKKTRQLMMIDITAKHLFLQMAEYDEALSGEDAPAGGASSSGQQVMGDDSGN